jgi:hypothetical protein
VSQVPIRKRVRCPSEKPDESGAHSAPCRESSVASGSGATKPLTRASTKPWLLTRRCQRPSLSIRGVRWTSRFLQPCWRRRCERTAAHDDAMAEGARPLRRPPPDGRLRPIDNRSRGMLEFVYIQRARAKGSDASKEVLVAARRRFAPVDRRAEVGNLPGTTRRGAGGR